MKIKIKYKKKRYYVNLYLAIFLLGYGVFQTYTSQVINFYDYGWYVVALIYFLLFAFNYPSNYLNIEDGEIKQNWLFGKKIKLEDIKKINLFSGVLTLKTEYNKIKINIDALEKQSYQVLKSELNKLNLEWS